jgi:uncharacterized protein YodC (DUF2158 family)
MADFSVGDVVRLKSGGPKMTVMWLPDREYTSAYTCAWFASDDERKTERFPAESLELVTNE